MRKLFVLQLLLLTLTLFACATTQPAVVSPALKQIRTVFIWDADGASDITLLRNLKAEAKKSLQAKGVVVSDDPSAAQAYVKVTVIDSRRNADTNKSFVNARLYVVDAAGGGTIYDKTAEAFVRGGSGYYGPEYPADKVIEKLLSDYPKTGEK